MYIAYYANKQVLRFTLCKSEFKYIQYVYLVILKQYITINDSILMVLVAGFAGVVIYKCQFLYYVQCEWFSVSYILTPHSSVGNNNRNNRKIVEVSRVPALATEPSQYTIYSLYYII